jgi:hypothetical protein
VKGRAVTQTPNDPNRRPAPKDDSLSTRVATAMLAVVAIPMLLPAAEPWFQGRPTLRVAAVAALVLPFAILSIRRLWRRRHRPEDPTDETRLRAAANTLAEAVKAQWSSEAAGLGLVIDSPTLLDLNWDTAAGRRGPWGRRVRPLTELADHFDGLKTHFKSPRLVILGEPETGKSASLVILTLSLLKSRSPESTRVPVLFTLADWTEPKSFEDWLIDRLTDQHPWLTAEGHGRDLPARLVRGGYILPVLDSLDEISARDTGSEPSDRTAASNSASVERRADLISAVNASALELPGLILSSRTAEYTEAESNAGRLVNAVVIELRPLTTKQIRSYLKAVIAPVALPAWTPVLDATSRDSVLGRALASPLVLTLLPKVYSGTNADPAELTRFPDAAALTAHVLREFAPTRFDPVPSRADRERGRLPRADAMRWLHFLASRTEKDGTWDAIRWWELSMLARTPTRIAAGVLGFVLSFTAVGMGAGIGFEETGLETRTAWVVGGSFGLVAGIALGVVCYRNRPPLPAETQVHTDGKQLMAALKSGVPIFLLAGIAGTAMFGPSRGALVGFGYALPIAAMYALVTPDPEARATNPRLLLRRDLRVGYVFGIAYAIPAFVLGFLVTDEFWMGLGFAVAAGLAGALLYGAQWFFALQGGRAGATASVHLALAILALAPRGRLPWRVMHFLEEAHDRGILRRQAGGTYEFRHANVAAAIAGWKPRSALPRPRGEGEGSEVLPHVQ